jgi:hypothetical protein
MTEDANIQYWSQALEGWGEQDDDTLPVCFRHAMLRAMSGANVSSLVTEHPCHCQDCDYASEGIPR